MKPRSGRTARGFAFSVSRDSPLELCPRLYGVREVDTGPAHAILDGMTGKRLEQSWHRSVPDGDTLPRLVCGSCGFIRYENPKVVVGSVITHGDRYLVCKRAIEPRKGFWTIPAGFMELGETPAEGAMREAREEACAEIAIDGLLAVYTIRHLSQVQMIFRATLVDPYVAAGPESEAAELVAFDEIPWNELAFPSVRWALHQHRIASGGALGAPFGNPNGEDGHIHD